LPKFLSPFPKRLKRITDGARAVMMNAVQGDELPSYFFPQSIFNARAFATLRHGKEAQRYRNSQSLIFLCGPRRSSRLRVNPPSRLRQGHGGRERLK